MPASPFEFIRLVVLPSIRPPGADQTASMDLPEEGVASISGTGGGVIDLTFSVSNSWSKQINKEEERTFDLVKINFTQPDGTIDEDTYIEAEIMHKVKFADGSKQDFTKPEIKDNMELIEENVVRTTSKQ